MGVGTLDVSHVVPPDHTYARGIRLVVSSRIQVFLMLLECYSRQESPPHVFARNLLYGLLVGVSSTTLPLDDLMVLQGCVNTC